MKSPSRHPLEKKLNAPAVDILEAIEHGFRAQVDVKGKLAELYLSRHFEGLQREGKISRAVWHDSDGQPDFEVFMVDGGKMRVECKNLRSSKAFSPERGCKVEIQKTRGGRDVAGRPTRGYLATHFDVLAVCTFNHTGNWGFRFIAAKNLALRDGDVGTLKVMQEVSLDGENGPWLDNFLEVAAKVSPP
ncbi:MAG: hypothetical protein IVW54_14025 [Candidatus Binataceae bacterium]|nr:hypothetical protein [Candidatus Binataceae bacterium]